ncbi:hypothetical protein [Nostoc sp.]|uniref:hypothetical protein n=1 Tax=Nostoc sp. TaxID=1180 RepID=UPI002FFC0675
MSVTFQEWGLKLSLAAPNSWWILAPDECILFYNIMTTIVNIDQRNEFQPSVLPKKDNPVGVDLGITTFATLSTGEKVDAPKPLKKRISRIRCPF